ETGGSTTLVIGRSDGQLLLARTLPGTWNDDPDRLALDLNRTILYSNQQYATMPVKGVWLFGAGAAEQCPAMQRQIQFPVSVSPVDSGPFYWPGESPKLSGESSPNFVSPELQKAPQRRVFATLVAAGTILAAAVGLGSAGYFLLQARQEMANVK